MLPTGIILLWSGAIVNIPAGWILCNGAGGSPDLRDRFVVGAGTTYNPDDSGGASTHTHAFTTDGHSHEIDAGSNIGTGTARFDETSVNTDTGTTNAGSSLPPYYSLAYIMKT